MWRPSSDSAVTTSTLAPSGRGRPRSDGCPSTFTAMAALARRFPMEAARSVPVAPAGNARWLPSGSVTEISSTMAGRLPAGVERRTGVWAGLGEDRRGLADALGSVVDVGHVGRRGRQRLASLVAALAGVAVPVLLAREVA